MSVGDRVQEEIVRKTDYNPADVDNILAKERCRKKVRHRTDDDEDKDGGADTPTTASVAEPPLNKRRKYKPQRLVHNKSSKMPEENHSKDKEGLESLEKKDSHDQQEPVNSQQYLRKDGQTSNSDQKYFPLFSQSIARSSEVKREKGRPRKPKITPIINYPKISDHFRPKTDSKLPNDQGGDEEGRGREGGASSCQSFELITVTRPTDIPMSKQRRKY